MSSNQCLLSQLLLANPHLQLGEEAPAVIFYVDNSGRARGNIASGSKVVTVNSHKLNDNYKIGTEFSFIHPYNGGARPGYLRFALS